MTESMSAPTVISQPLVRCGREIGGDLPSALRREWLVTNGLGSYASGTVAGVNTRRYHGLLVTALNPPVDRTVMVSGLVEWATYDGRRAPLSANEFAGGTVDPQGYRYLQSFALEGLLPVWTYALGDALLERRVWMVYGADTTYVEYRLVRGSGALQMEITPLVTYRSFHSLSSGQGWQLGVEPQPRGVTVRAFEGARPFRLLADDGQFTPGAGWWWNFAYREETARGLDDHGDLYGIGTFTTTLTPGASYALTLTAEAGEPARAGDARAAAEDRQRQLLRAAAAEAAHPVVQQLTLAADQFIVGRVPPRPSEASSVATPAVHGSLENKTVIAGYHWFNDWGRDTMISLRGLALATGRPEDAANILRSFAQYIEDGLLPNNFPDQSGAVPGYNTVDATLWYIVAIAAYEQATGDEALMDELLPALRQIVDAHTRGTRYHIGVDPQDGLLHAGEPGVQLTWMDAKVGDLVVTPRIGKPVEIQALWYNALRIVAAALAQREDSTASQYAAQADRVRASFLARFRRPDRASLADVVDGPGGDDWTFRPSQIFAVSLPYPLLEGDEAVAVVDVAEPQRSSLPRHLRR